MHHLCLIGGMDIKNILLIFSTHRFTVQEKPKANKPQTENIAIIHLWHGRLHAAEPNPGPPGGTEGPLLPCSQPGIAHQLAGVSSIPRLELAHHGAQDTAC